MKQMVLGGIKGIFKLLAGAWRRKHENTNHAPCKLSRMNRGMSYLGYLVLMIFCSLPYKILRAETFGFEFPVSNYNVFDNCDYKDVCAKVAGGHSGEDIVLPEGTPVVAASDGVIAHYKCRNGYGELLAIVNHDLQSFESITNGNGVIVSTNKVRTIYGHIRKSSTRDGVPLTFSVGDVVKQGQVLGYVNDSGSWSDPPSACNLNTAHNGIGQPHLHFGVGLSHFSDWDSYGYGHHDLFTDPTNFIVSHPGIIVRVSGDISTGNIAITGLRLGTSPGKVVVTIPFVEEFIPLFQNATPNASQQNLSFDAAVTPNSWTDTSIQVNIFNNVLKWDAGRSGGIWDWLLSKFDLLFSSHRPKTNFLAPVFIAIYKSDGTKLGEVSYPFSDVPSTSGAGGKIHALWLLGITSGKGDGTFGREAKVTRAELLKMLLQGKPGFLLPTISSSSFADVAKDAWYAPYTEYAKSNGYVTGGGPGKCPVHDPAYPTSASCFRPDDPITRYEASIMATKVYELTWWDENKRPTWSDYRPDADDKAPWIAYSHHVMHGYDASRFGMIDPLTREQAAIIISNAMSATKP